MINTLKKDSLHHAYILEGEREELYNELCNFCESELNFSTKANPDFWYEEIDKFVISDARRLREMQLKKTTNTGRKIFIIALNFITREAENSLLKVLEEPTKGTHVFLITPTSNVFLETVLSRVVVIKSNLQNETSNAKKFLKSSYAERINMVSKMVKDIKDEKTSKAEAIRLIRDLKKTLHGDLRKNIKRAKVLKELNKIESYLNDNGASVKMLLEHASLVV